jgi:hypothetical protein
MHEVERVLRLCLLTDLEFSELISYCFRLRMQDR